MHAKQQGFTIIEILTVLAVIGILTSIVIPMYHGYQIRARNAQALSDVYHLYLFESQFYDEYHEFVPITPTDKQASGLISLSISLPDGSTAPFEIRNLSADVKMAATTDASKQSIVVAGLALGSTEIIAMDPDAPDGYHAIALSGTFTAASIPQATAGNDLSSYPIYSK